MSTRILVLHLKNKRMTINEWKEKFAELHKEMKEDLGISCLEVEIEESGHDWPYLNPKSAIVRFRM